MIPPLPLHLANDRGRRDGRNPYPPGSTVIVVRVRGVGGEGAARIDRHTWDSMSAAARVLELHDQCRDVLRGERFDVLSERVE